MAASDDPVSRRRAGLHTRSAAGPTFSHVDRRLSFDRSIRAHPRYPRQERPIILHRHPLTTSARKLQLYRKRGMGRRLLKSIFHPMKTAPVEKTAPCRTTVVASKSAGE